MAIPKLRTFEEEFNYQVDNDLCGGRFCINPDCYCDDRLDEVCPFCGYEARGGQDLYIAGNGRELWACWDCAEDLPDNGCEHYVSCPECQQTPNTSVPDFSEVMSLSGCAEYQRIMAEYDRIMGPIFHAWERGEKVRLAEVL